MTKQAGYISLLLCAGLLGCGASVEPALGDGPAPETPVADPDADPAAGGDDHEHEEFPIGEITLDGLTIELAQGHGGVVAGEEAHLVVKLPYTDQGATVVRAWIGTEDRTLSRVGKGEYAPSHDDYDLHAEAPDPLPENPRWWIELEKPDGTRSQGSAEPLFD